MKIIDLQKKLGRFELDILSLEIESGCIHGFIGGNGSGKNHSRKADCRDSSSRFG
ncbi:MAG TPA: hypothetical protein VHP54_00300 [Caproiciproducens sp.]|nr:hypothetical protein [Caproiciproducens sp.]